MGQVMVNIHMIKIFAVFVHLSLLLLILDLNGRFNLKKKKKRSLNLKHKEYGSLKTFPIFQVFFTLSRFRFSFQNYIPIKVILMF